MMEFFTKIINIEAVVRRCSVKKLFLEISQKSQENTCARVPFLIKLQAPPATLLKKRLWHRSFPVNFAKLSRTPFFIEQLWCLLLLKLTAVNYHGPKYVFESCYEILRKTFAIRGFRVFQIALRGRGNPLTPVDFFIGWQESEEE